MKPSELEKLSVDKFTTPTVTLNSSHPVSKAIGILRDSNSHEVFIEERERTAVVTLRDLLNAQNITTTKLSNLMHYVPRLTARNTVRDAASLMVEYRIKALPVHKGNGFEGKITAQSIINNLMEGNAAVKVTKLMTPSPICVDSADEVSKARRIMLKRKIDQIPILQNLSLKRVITSGSIVFNLLPTSDRNVKGALRESRFDVSVVDYALDEICSNGISDSLNDVYRNMVKMRTQYSVITNMDEVQGIITLRDFMRLLVEPKKPDAIPMYMVGLPEDPFEAEATREKFTRIVKLLEKSLPQLTEARAVIKAKDKKSARTKYEAQIFVSTLSEHYSYKGVGFELPEVFDEISAWAKRLVGRSDAKKRRTRPDPGTLE